MATNSETTLWFYFRSTAPVYTHSLAPDDARLAMVLDDVRKVKHGSHVFVHLRSEYEWERAMHCLSVSTEDIKFSGSPAA